MHRPRLGGSAGPCPDGSFTWRLTVGYATESATASVLWRRPDPLPAERFPGVCSEINRPRSAAGQNRGRPHCRVCRVEPAGSSVTLTRSLWPSARGTSCPVSVCAVCGHRSRLPGALLGTLCSGRSPCSRSPVPQDAGDAVSEMPVLRRPRPRVILAALAVSVLWYCAMGHARVWHLWKRRLLSRSLPPCCPCRGWCGCVCRLPRRVGRCARCCARRVPLRRLPVPAFPPGARGLTFLTPDGGSARGQRPGSSLVLRGGRRVMRGPGAAWPRPAGQLVS